MNRQNTHVHLLVRPVVRPLVARWTFVPVTLAAGALLAAACRPIVPASPTQATPSTDTASQPSTPVAEVSPPSAVDSDLATPDPWGYAPGDTWFEPLDDGDDAELLTQLQALLDARDVDGLAGLVGPPAASTAQLRLRAADGEDALAMLAVDDARAALARLLAAAPPSWPAVQGSVHGTSDAAGSDAASADVWVAISGWPVDRAIAATTSAASGTTESAASGTTESTARTTSTGTMVWRFTPADDGWRWIEWRLGEATYVESREDLRQDLQGDATYSPFFRPVRRAEWWPPNDAPCEVVSTSPDGAWTACTGEGEARDVGVGHFRPLRLEVRSADGARTHVAVSRWEGADGFPQLGVKVVGWSTNPPGLLYATTGCGDGCGPWLCHEEDLTMLTVPDGRIEPMDVEGTYPALSPDGTRLATLGAGEPDGIVLHVTDLGTGAVRTIPLPGQDGDLAWSPDGAAVAVVWDEAMCEDGWRTGWSVVDVTSGAVRAVGSPESGIRYIADWPSADVIELNVNRPDGDDRWEGIERRDARTGALLGAATATPQP